MKREGELYRRRHRGRSGFSCGNRSSRKTVGVDGPSPTLFAPGRRLQQRSHQCSVPVELPAKQRPSTSPPQMWRHSSLGGGVSTRGKGKVLNPTETATRCYGNNRLVGTKQELLVNGDGRNPRGGGGESARGISRGGEGGGWREDIDLQRPRRRSYPSASCAPRVSGGAEESVHDLVEKLRLSGTNDPKENSSVDSAASWAAKGIALSSVRTKLQPLGAPPPRSSISIAAAKRRNSFGRAEQRGGRDFIASSSSSLRIERRRKQK